MAQRRGGGRLGEEADDVALLHARHLLQRRLHSPNVRYLETHREVGRAALALALVGEHL